LLEPGPEIALRGHSLRVVALCTTERPPCAVIVRVRDPFDNVERQRVALEGDSVATTLDLAAFEGRSAHVGVLAHGAGTDTAWVGSIVMVSQDAAARFTVVDSAGQHAILDADASRMVVRTPGGAAVIDRQTRALTPLPTDIVPAGSHAVAATLMPDGGYVSYDASNPERAERYWIMRRWSNLRPIGPALTGQIGRVEGRWAHVWDARYTSGVCIICGWSQDYALELETGRAGPAFSSAFSLSPSGRLYFHSDTAIERIDLATGTRYTYPLPAGTRAALVTAPVETEDGLVLQLPLTDGTGWVTLLATAQDTILLGRHDDGPFQQWPTAASRDGWTAYTGTEGGVYYCRVRGPDGTLATALAGPEHLVVQAVGPLGQVIIRSAAGRRHLWRPGGSIKDLGTLDGRILFIDGTAHVLIGNLLLVPR
jgi:hypothetical protein